MSSPKKSMRTGCGASGGNTSRIPPRTATSPRRDTRSTRWYPSSTRERDTPSRSLRSPTAMDRIGRSPKSAASGCRAARTLAMMTRLSMPFQVRSARSVAMRVAMVSLDGLRRSWGRVSHDGKMRVRTPQVVSDSARDWASFPVAVTRRTSFGSRHIAAIRGARAPSSRDSAGPRRRFAASTNTDATPRRLTSTVYGWAKIRTASGTAVALWRGPREQSTRRHRPRRPQGSERSRVRPC